MKTTLTIKDVIDEDFINYKKPSMFIATSKCNFKCEKEDCNVKCQNSKIVKQPNMEVSINCLIDRYLNNKLTSAIVFGGLEPFDQFDEIVAFIYNFRNICNDDIVIYTGYTEEEINSFKYENKTYLEKLLEVNKIIPKNENDSSTLIIKYGRFKASGDKKYDEILGIKLASSNQYAKSYE